MLYQLPNGVTIEISVDDFFALSDEELKGLIAYPHIGEHINNPFYGSVVNKVIIRDNEEEFIDLDINEIPDEEQLNDQDYIIDDE